MPATRRRGGSAAHPDHLRRWLGSCRFRAENTPASLRTEAFGSAPGSSATLARELSFSSRKHAGIIADRGVRQRTQIICDVGSGAVVFSPGLRSALRSAQRKRPFFNAASAHRDTRRSTRPRAARKTKNRPSRAAAPDRRPNASRRAASAGPHPTGRVRRAVRSSRRRPGRRHRRCPARCRRARSAPRPRPPSTGS